MGATFSSASSYQQYTNDFELVIRATKDLEYLLEQSFHAPSGKQVGLHDKISHAQQTFGLTQDTVKQMRYLVTIRNKLVHDHEFNRLPDRVSFAKSYDSVEKELKQHLKHNKSSDGACTIS
mmetsp:Transcript_14984/g.27179  ORF Transcript_14984/g.27179 Transcript_14984/m.27179 type:complete len:121 (-) Transcript_14984:1-363(-)